MEERRPDRGPGGVDAGEEQEDAHAEDLGVLEGAAVRHAGVEEVGDDVVTRGCAVILDVAGEVPADLEDGVEGGLAGERALLDEAVDPVPEPGVVAVGDPEHPGDDLDGDVLGVVRSGVTFPAVDEPIDEIVGHRLGDGLVGGHHRRGELRQQQPADVGVVRGVLGDGRCVEPEVGRRFGPVGDQDRAGREPLVVVGDGGEVLVASGDPHAVVPVGVRDGALVA